MPQVTIYTGQLCGYCHAAKQLLKKKGVAFHEIDVTLNPRERSTMVEKSGRRTVPQIFIGGTHVGGCDDLYALEARGQLDALLASSHVREKG